MILQNNHNHEFMFSMRAGITNMYVSLNRMKGWTANMQE